MRRHTLLLLFLHRNIWEFSWPPLRFYLWSLQELTYIEHVVFKWQVLLWDWWDYFWRVLSSKAFFREGFKTQIWETQEVLEDKAFKIQIHIPILLFVFC